MGKAAVRRFRHPTYRDDITGLGNRRAYMLAYRERVRRLLKSVTAFALVLLDLDDFGRFKKLYGGAVGNQALSAAARGLRSQAILLRLPGCQRRLGIAQPQLMVDRRLRAAKRSMAGAGASGGVAFRVRRIG